MTHSRIRAILCALSSLALATAQSSEAQAVIVVRASGIAVVAAEVSLWDVQGSAGFGRTNDVGTVRIALERALATGAFVVVRRLGYAPVRVPYEMLDSMTIAMTAVAALLPSLTVRTTTLRCPSATEPEADSVWRASASRYSARLTQFTVDWTGYVVGENVTSEGRGYPNPGEVRQPPYTPLGSSQKQPVFDDPPPYAVYGRYNGPFGEFREWRYSLREIYSADHFLSERFHQRHSLVVLGTTGSTTTIGFCSQDESQADVQGELQIGVNALLMGARWSFRVPHDDEDAGGEATYAPTVHDGREYIVAIRGSSWRRVEKNRYSQMRFEHARWELHPRR